MNSTADQPAPALVIIRRRGGDGEEGHHGGMWKIAFADFMTAMMAFFLVMWLLNATDEKVLSKVAQYFNPLPMASRTLMDKGVGQVEDSEPEASGKGEADEKTDGQKKKRKFSDQEILEDPKGVVEKIASENQKRKSVLETRKNDVAVRKSAPPNFNSPLIFQRLPENGTEPKKNRSGAPKKPVVPDVSAEQVDVSKKNESRKYRDKGEDRNVRTKSPKNSPEKNNLSKKTEVSEHTSKQRPKEIQIVDDIKKITTGFEPGTVPNIYVENTQEGLLISLTDEFDFGMFAVGSAEPNSRLVLIMSKLAKVLSKRKEPIVIRGHTDGTPFRSKKFDNWRLSTLRAHMARYMLLRSGILKEQIIRIEGHADRKLRNMHNAAAAENRRIELLLLENKK